MKNRLLLTTILIISYSGMANAQGNLIANGSFESYVGSCPVYSPNGAFSQVVGWSNANIIPGHGVPHAELYCNGTPNYGNCLPGPAGASDGDAYVGFHTRIISTPYNEAIYHSLSSPIIPFNSYRISFDLITCQTGLFTAGPSDLCVYGNVDTIIPGCPTQNPAVVTLACVPFDSISNTVWKYHQIDFVVPAGSDINVIAFSGAACFTSEVYYYLDNVVLTETTSLTESDYSENVLHVIGPNPFSEKFYIELNEDEDFIFEMFDRTGKILITESLKRNSKTEFSFSNELASGIYFYRISNNNKTYISKLVRQK